MDLSFGEAKTVVLTVGLVGTPCRKNEALIVGKVRCIFGCIVASKWPNFARIAALMLRLSH